MCVHGAAKLDALFTPYMSQELLTQFGLLERATEVGGRSDGLILLNPTHLHAHVLCFDNYHHALGL